MMTKGFLAMFGSRGNKLMKVEENTDWVRSVFMSADATRVISGSNYRSIGIWDAASGKDLPEMSATSETQNVRYVR